MADSNKKKQLIKKAMLDSLAANLGNVTKACEAVGICRKTYYEYLKDDDFKLEVESIEESNIDFAESKLFQLIDGVSLITDGANEPTVYKSAPNVTATIFYLKTKGKKRGYIEKTEQDINQTIQIIDESE